jgi:tRNA(Ile)-lysidine synthase
MPLDTSANSPLFPRSTLHPAVLAWADAHANDDAPWCVAFSGGADSVALIVTLCQHWPERRIAGKLIALHYNHHLRGKDSDGDQAFCEDFCAHQLGMPVHFGHWLKPVFKPGSDSPGFDSHDSNSPDSISHVSEAEARKHRHEFLEYQMSAIGANALWLGHQRDDIAETQLMRLARGSSTAGLAAPRPVHARADGRVFLRPLLTLSKKQIIAALRTRGLAWREDATNRQGDFFRNRIRRDVLPAWTTAAENDALAGAALTRELLDEDATALDAWLAEILPASALTRDSINLRPLAGKPRALLRRALRRWPPAAELARAGFETLLAICENNTHATRTTHHTHTTHTIHTTPASPAAHENHPRPCQTSVGDAIAIFENGILRIKPPSSALLSALSAARSSIALPSTALSSAAPPPFSFSVTPPFTLTLPDGATITARQITLTAALRADILAGCYEPIDTIFIVSPPPPNTTLVIRSWQPGDRYQPLGAPGSAKISDLFINRKIPPARRLALPVICIPSAATGNRAGTRVGADIATGTRAEILWVPGLPPADAWKIKTQTQQALHLTYQCGTCTVHP